MISCFFILILVIFLGFLCALVIFIIYNIID